MSQTRLTGKIPYQKFGWDLLVSSVYTVSEYQMLKQLELDGKAPNVYIMNRHKKHHL